MLRPGDLTCQRPGTGLPARHLDRILGQVLRHPVAAGTMIDWQDVRPLSGAAA